MTMIVFIEIRWVVFRCYFRTLPQVSLWIPKLVAQVVVRPVVAQHLPLIILTVNLVLLHIPRIIIHLPALITVPKNRGSFLPFHVGADIHIFGGAVSVAFISIFPCVFCDFIVVEFARWTNVSSINWRGVFVFGNSDHFRRLGILDLVNVLGRSIGSQAKCEFFVACI